VPADTVVICLGPWTGPALSTWLGLETVVTGSRAHSITVAVPDQAQVDNTALFLQSNGEPELYPRPDGTVYVCGGAGREDAPLPALPGQVECDPAACARVKAVAGEVSEVLAAVQQFTPSACYLPHSKDGVPLIGRLPSPPAPTGLAVAAGHSCWGILQGPATGEALAELLLFGAPRQVELKKFDPARFYRKTKR